ncbi:hypothetical protein DACRYDRAFT_119829 [Dacryopinax primogenitus]|uniref:SCP domain-containing protein n=1 Tax=Dacryopinax primogenitus (strain DJM 731) TaxID=1858805 RepID=M5FUU8_DACPD|nr:uncharacterized protein DACRYDRAFT_119829 [Dacryopinax primogenitus]EJT97051.1 hypothetical protein DACRYDRAFT_119829 [Dacryopinax primogenitus]
MFLFKSFVFTSLAILTAITALPIASRVHSDESASSLANLRSRWSAMETYGTGISDLTVSRRDLTDDDSAPIPRRSVKQCNVSSCEVASTASKTAREQSSEENHLRAAIQHAEAAEVAINYNNPNHAATHSERAKYHVGEAVEFNLLRPAIENPCASTTCIRAWVASSQANRSSNTDDHQYASSTHAQAAQDPTIMSNHKDYHVAVATKHLQEVVRLRASR